MNTVENKAKYDYNHFSEIEYIKIGEIIGAFENIEKNSPDKLGDCYDIIVFNNKESYFAITVLAVVLREKAFRHYKAGNIELSEEYFKLYTVTMMNFKDKFSTEESTFLIQESCYYDRSFLEIIEMFLR